MLTLPERLARRVLNVSGLKSRRVATRVGDIHVLDGAGGGGLPPIVVLHGLAAHAVCYGGLLKRFQPHVRRVIAPDMPGHGFSSLLRPGDPPTVLLDALVETLDRVLDQPALILGNSMGGLVAIRYALARPHMVRGLALVSPGGAPLPRPSTRPSSTASASTPTARRSISSTTCSPRCRPSCGTRSRTTSAAASTTRSCASCSGRSLPPCCSRRRSSRASTCPCSSCGGARSGSCRARTIASSRKICPHTPRSRNSPISVTSVSWSNRKL
ncbi:alpha/beta fold hydrolase [Nannocystis pusilla]|uniref:alpha/beta fold hydrolase n=1 Tax=Nannocystis pusilla TaxID=889268 RepID=UPI003B763D4C